jgi:uncharacterized membrane protein
LPRHYSSTGFIRRTVRRETNGDDDMSDIKNLSRKEAEEKLQTRQADLAKVFDAAKTSEGYDYSKAISSVSGATDAIAVAEHVKALNAEADQLAKHVETFLEADKAAAALEAGA